MEYIVKELHLPEEDDEPNFVYSELDSGRLEPGGWNSIPTASASPTAATWDMRKC